MKYIIIFVQKNKIITKMKKTQNLVTIKQYADLCKVSFVTILNRENKGEIKFVLSKRKNVKGEFSKLIDIDKYPPLAAKKRGLKPYIG